MDPQQQPTENQDGGAPSGEGQVPPAPNPGDAAGQAPAPNDTPVMPAEQPQTPPLPPAETPMPPAETPAPIPIDPDAPQVAMPPAPVLPTDGNQPMAPKDPSKSSMKVLLIVVLAAVVLAAILFVIFK
jgi:hypothetical protein